MASIEPRVNNKGKITSYRIRVHKGKTTDGKNLKPYETTWKVPTGKNWTDEKIEKELNKFATLFEEKCKQGMVADGKYTFAQYSEIVINHKEKVEKLKHRTIKRYKELIIRINDGIGHIKLSDIKPQHLNALYEQLSQNGMNLKTGGYLSTKTILEHHRLIHTILKQAEKEMLIPFNPADKAIPPKNQKKIANYLDDEQVRYILDWLVYEPLKWQVAINLLAFTGGRRGEICGLKIDKIKTKTNEIEFSQSILYASDIGVYESTLKTESSNRIVQIPEKPMLLIKKLIQELKKKKSVLGTAWEDTGYLLTQENGKPMHPDSITGYCDDFRIKYNKIIEAKNKELPKNKQLPLIPKMNPHAFRHAQASILIYYGVDTVSISHFLGHSSPVVTQSIYQHLIKRSSAQIASINSKLLS